MGASTSSSNELDKIEEVDSETNVNPEVEAKTSADDTNLQASVEDEPGESSQTGQDEGSGTLTPAQIRDYQVEEEEEPSWNEENLEDISKMSESSGTESMLFTWKGFKEKLAAVGRSLASPCFDEVNKTPTPPPLEEPLEEPLEGPSTPIHTPILIESVDAQEALPADENIRESHREEMKSEMPPANIEVSHREKAFSEEPLEDVEVSHPEEVNSETPPVLEKDRTASLSFETDEGEFSDEENTKTIEDNDAKEETAETVVGNEGLIQKMVNLLVAEVSNEAGDGEKGDDDQASETAQKETPEKIEEEAEEEIKEVTEEEYKEGSEGAIPKENNQESSDKSEEVPKEETVQETMEEATEEKMTVPIVGTADQIPGKVDPKIKRRFKRHIREHAKNVVKSKSVLGVIGKKDSDVIITPTVLRIDADFDKKKAEKANVSASKHSANSEKDVKDRVVAVTGEEGHGKTMLLNRYADMAMGRLLTVNEAHHGGIKRWHPFSRKNFFKFVHVFNYHDLPTEGQFTPCELLLKEAVGDVKDGDTEEECRWLAQYQKGAIFIIDDLDAMEVFSRKNHKPLEYHDKGSPSCVLHNLLTGYIFPHAFVLLSSSTMNIRSFPDDAFTPNRIYELQSFKRTEVKSFFEKNASVWRKLNEKFPNLLAKCEVPLFCLYTSVAFHSDDYSHDSLVSAMAQYIRYALCDDGSWSPETLARLAKVTKLAFRSKTERKFVLNDELLADVGLSPEEALNTSLFTAKPMKMPPDEDGKKQYSSCRYSHTTIQDFLAVLHLCESNVVDFIDFTKEHIDQPGFNFLKSQLFATFMDQTSLQSMSDMITASFVEEKQVILMQHLRSSMLSHRSVGDQIRFYTFLHDCREGIDHILKGNLRSLSVTEEKLTLAGLYILASLAARVGNIEILKLENCEVTDDVLLQLWKDLQSHAVKIRVICLRGNIGIRFVGPSLRKLVQHCKSEELDISACELHADTPAALLRSFKDTELRRLVVGENTAFGDSSMHALGDFVRRTGVKSLGINECALNQSKLQKLKKSLKNAQLEALDVSGNKKLGIQATAELGMIAYESGVQELNMSKCDLTKEEIQNLEPSLQSLKMKSLDISSTEPCTASTADISAVAKLLIHVTEELRMANWDVTGESLSLLQESLNKMPASDLKISHGANGESVTTQTAKAE